MIASALVTLGVFLSGFVISEPAPYELFMAGLIGIWALLGLRISRGVAPLLALYLTFNIGGMLSLTVMDEMAGGPMYVAVSIFLALSSVFFAAIIEARPQRLRLIFRAWVASALITASLGILGYFNAFPGSEVFTLYDRAKGAFQDPNVFGPFLVAPALYLMHGLLAKPLTQAPLNIAGLLVIALGLFLSFSRAAWALFLFSAVAMVFVMLLKERTGVFRLKILTLSIAAVGLMVVALVIALQIPQVADLGLQAEGAEWSIAAGVVNSDLVFSVRNVGYVRAAGEVVRAVVEGLGVGGGHRSMAKGIIPLKVFRESFGKADQPTIRRALLEAFAKAIHSEPA